MQLFFVNLQFNLGYNLLDTSKNNKYKSHAEIFEILKMYILIKILNSINRKSSLERPQLT